MTNLREMTYERFLAYENWPTECTHQWIELCLDVDLQNIYIFVKHQLWDGQDLLVYSGKSLNIHKYDFIHLSWQWCGFRGWCFLISYWLVFTTCKAEQPLKSIDLKKKRQIWKASRRMDYKEPKDNRCLFSLDLKLFK